MFNVCLGFLGQQYSGPSIFKIRMHVTCIPSHKHDFTKASKPKNNVSFFDLLLVDTLSYCVHVGHEIGASWLSDGLEVIAHACLECNHGINNSTVDKHVRIVISNSKTLSTSWSRIWLPFLDQIELHSVDKCLGRKTT